MQHYFNEMNVMFSNTKLLNFVIINLILYMCNAGKTENNNGNIPIF